MSVKKRVYACACVETIVVWQSQCASELEAAALRHQKPLLEATVPRGWHLGGQLCGITELVPPTLLSLSSLGGLGCPAFSQCIQL
eukprot:m.157498 g.157498  ORF g.157498 m.157498 type:complete len:85 (-) comp23666_c0_seq3:1319-1573(-)